MVDKTIHFSKFNLVVIVFLFLTIVLLSISETKTVAAEGRISSDLQEISEIQTEVSTEVFSILEEVYGSVEKFEEVGVIYGNEDGSITLELSEKIYQLDQIQKNETLIEKLENNKQKEKIKINVSLYSAKELEKLQDKVLDELKKLNISGDNNEGLVLEISLQKGVVILTVGKIKDTDEIHLLKTFGNDLVIEISNIKPEYSIARERDWTNLGGGIRWHAQGKGNCTNGAIGHKGGNYFMISAGHCIAGNTGPNAFQDTSYVGSLHSNLQYAGYDIGLVKIEPSGALTYPRRASSYLYKWAEIVITMMQE